MIEVLTASWMKILLDYVQCQKDQDTEGDIKV